MKFKHFVVAVLQCLLVPPVFSQVVISQVYGGGGNTGSVYRNDFIELLNIGRDSVDLTGWTVQYASASGGTWQVTSLAGKIAPGYYYLVQEAQGSGGTTDLPLPDAVGVISMAAASGKVALVRAVAALSGSCPASPEREDFVGYGSASCYEGSGAAPAPGNTVAVTRKNGGATDTQDNLADFITGTASPRNGTYPPLPVQLVSFAASLSPPGVVLEWRTATEVNNFGFYVQRSLEVGGRFEDLSGGFVAGHGTSLIPHTYSWTDAVPPAEELLYRLRQVDLDGAEHYSPQVSVDASLLVVLAEKHLEPTELSIRPNPFNPMTIILYTLERRSHVEVAVHDLLGREVRTLVDGVQDAGLHEAVFNGSTLASGAYLCRLRAEGRVSQRKILLLR
jgi:hypothetical protein